MADARDRREDFSEGDLHGYLNDQATAWPNSHYPNPGPTPNLRGIEPNTAPRGLEYPVSVPSPMALGVNQDPCGMNVRRDASGDVAPAPDYPNGKDPH